MKPEIQQMIKLAALSRGFLWRLSHHWGVSKEGTKLTYNFTLPTVSNVKTLPCVSQEKDLQHILGVANSSCRTAGGSRYCLSLHGGIWHHNHNPPICLTQPFSPKELQKQRSVPPLVKALRGYSFKKAFLGISQELWPPPQDSRQLSWWWWLRLSF